MARSKTTVRKQTTAPKKAKTSAVRATTKKTTETRAAAPEPAPADQDAAAASGPPVPDAAPAQKTRGKNKALIELLSRDGGATIQELMSATGWQQHSVRGAISGSLKKKMKLAVISEKLEGRGRIYRIAA